MAEERKLIGYCKHCGQGVSISETDEYLEESEDLDFIASMRCRCAEGEGWRRKNRAKDDAMEKIRTSFDAFQDENQKNVMLLLVDPLVEGDIESAALNFGGGLTVNMRLNKNNAVRIAVRRSNSTIIE